MKNYLQTIRYTQDVFLALSIVILCVLPCILAFKPSVISGVVFSSLYTISHVSIFFVMAIRPLADIFLDIRFLRPLVILRKGVGVLSASIVVSIMLSKIIIDPVAFFSALGTFTYWSLTNLALLTHLADITAVLLLITSNHYSKRILGLWWKRVQRLSYVYFYASGVYVLVILGETTMYYSLGMVSILTLLAFLKNRRRRLAQSPTVISPVPSF